MTDKLKNKYFTASFITIHKNFKNEKLKLDFIYNYLAKLDLLIFIELFFC